MPKTTSALTQLLRQGFEKSWQNFLREKLNALYKLTSEIFELSTRQTERINAIKELEKESQKNKTRIQLLQNSLKHIEHAISQKKPQTKSKLENFNPSMLQYLTDNQYVAPDTSTELLKKILDLFCQYSEDLDIFNVKSNGQEENMMVDVLDTFTSPITNAQLKVMVLNIATKMIQQEKSEADRLDTLSAASREQSMGKSPFQREQSQKQLQEKLPAILFKINRSYRNQFLTLLSLDKESMVQILKSDNHDIIRLRLYALGILNTKTTPKSHDVQLYKLLQLLSNNIQSFEQALKIKPQFDSLLETLLKSKKDFKIDNIFEAIEDLVDAIQQHLLATPENEYHLLTLKYGLKKIINDFYGVDEETKSPKCISGEAHSYNDRTTPSGESSIPTLSHTR